MVITTAAIGVDYLFIFSSSNRAILSSRRACRPPSNGAARQVLTIRRSISWAVRSDERVSSRSVREITQLVGCVLGGPQRKVGEAKPLASRVPLCTWPSKCCSARWCGA